MNFTINMEGNLELVEEDKKKPTKLKKKAAATVAVAASGETKKKVVLKEYSLVDSKAFGSTAFEAAAAADEKKFKQAMREFEDSYDEENYAGSSDEEFDIPELLEGGILSGEGFNKILDEHISEMSKVKQEQYAKEERKTGKPAAKVNAELEEMQKERYAKYEGIAEFDDIVRRRIYEQLPVATDHALQSYLVLEQRREDFPHLFFENYDRPQGENKLDETIATKNFSFSRVHENLSIVGDDINLSRSKKYLRLRHAEEEEAEKKKESKKV